jgi:hypothetical protein
LGFDDAKKIPTNLEECFEVLKTFDGVKEFKLVEEKRVVGLYHFNLGQHLRNDWKLWDESDKSKLVDYFNKLGIYHADDMSGIILLSFHRHLNSKPIELEKQVKVYEKFWALKFGNKRIFSKRMEKPS